MPRKKPELNRREKSILHFIEKQIMTQGYPPSVREIGKAVGLNSTATVHGYLARVKAASTRPLMMYWESRPAGTL